MREELLHFIWKYKKLPLADLYTTGSEVISIIDVGTHNQLSGPDFFNAKVKIGEQLWAGTVEIHLKSSDWYAHHHEKDPNYDNVILHVVWEDDVSVFRKEGTEIPTVALKNYVSSKLLGTYQNLFDKKKYNFINCESAIAEVDDFEIQHWFERLYFERLERKSTAMFELLKKSKNNWEQVLFSMLLKNFGLKINGEAFMSLAAALEFTVVRKLRADPVQLESVFYGMSHLLNDETIIDTHYTQLKNEFAYLTKKFHLQNDGVLKPEFFKLRPPNFPTIRLSQLANVYGKHQNLFDKVVNTSSLKELCSLFEVTASPYWNNHYTFGKPSKKSTKRLTHKFIDLLIINTILPLKFCYAQYLGQDVNEEIIGIISQLKPEKNTVISNFKNHGVTAVNAKDSQSMLQLYNTYCTKNRCLACAIGNSILNES